MFWHTIYIFFQRKACFEHRVWRTFGHMLQENSWKVSLQCLSLTSENMKVISATNWLNCWFQVRKEFLRQYDDNSDLVRPRRSVRNRKLRGVFRYIKIVNTALHFLRGLISSKHTPVLRSLLNNKYLKKKLYNISFWIIVTQASVLFATHFSISQVKN